MSAVLKTQPWQWPAEVVAYADKYNVAEYLEPLRQATLRLFPTTKSFRIFLEDDPEIRDLAFLVFEVIVTVKDVPDYLAAKRRWNDEFFRILPPPYQCPFVRRLLRKDS